MSFNDKPRKLNIVVPVFNEAATLDEFYRRIQEAINDLNAPNWSVTLTFVNDGSTDASEHILEGIVSNCTDFNITVIKLSRNFGHQQAVWAGIEKSEKFSCVLVMDSDLQDPPEMIKDFIAELEESDVVIAQRRRRADSHAKKLFANIFYKIIGILSDDAVRANVGDFWALSERAKDSLLSYNEELKFLRGLVSQLGFRTKVLSYDRDQRYAGKTHYTIFKMIQLAIAGITGFTIKPLIYTIYVAVVVSLMLMPAALFLAWTRLSGDSVISPGLTFVGIVIIIAIGLQFIVLAVIALYIARIAIEVKKRPVYILDTVSKRIDRDEL